jgi:hypothetical protein
LEGNECSAAGGFPSDPILSGSALNKTKLTNKYYIKDIAQPKKRGVKRVTNRIVLASYTIADTFSEHLKGYSLALNSKNPVSAFRAKKMWSFFMWSPLPKTQRRVKGTVQQDGSGRN